MKQNEPDKTLLGRVKVWVKRWTASQGRLSDKIFTNLTLVSALLIVAILVGFIVVLNIDAMPAIRKFGAAFIIS
ncbi:MAG: hypothetical protein Q7K41_04985, partial [Dehalococcoidales bacterium]|nr:hypothetical protein [Dehalococcoidales bacterium]